jgi:hypothetical protein
LEPPAFTGSGGQKGISAKNGQRGGRRKTRGGSPYRDPQQLDDYSLDGFLFLTWISQLELVKFFENYHEKAPP